MFDRAVNMLLAVNQQIFNIVSLFKVTTKFWKNLPYSKQSSISPPNMITYLMIFVEREFWILEMLDLQSWRYIFARHPVGMVDLSRPITKNNLNNTILFIKNYITVPFEDFGIIRKFLITCLQQQHSLEEINHR